MTWPEPCVRNCAKRRLGDGDDPEEVGLDLRTEVVEAGVLDRGEVGVSGVVDTTSSRPKASTAVRTAAAAVGDR